MGFKDGSAQLSYQFLSIFRGEQFDRSKPLLRQAEIRVGLNSESDIQDIETARALIRTFIVSPKLNSESDIQDIETPLMNSSLISVLLNSESDIQDIETISVFDVRLLQR